MDEIDKMTECHNMDKFITNGIVILLAQDLNEIWFLEYNRLNSLKLKKLNQITGNITAGSFMKTTGSLRRLKQRGPTVRRTRTDGSLIPKVFCFQKRTGADGSLMLNW